MKALEVMFGKITDQFNKANRAARTQGRTRHSPPPQQATLKARRGPGGGSATAMTWRHKR